MTDRGKMNLDKVWHWQAFLFVFLSFQSLATAQVEKAMQSEIKTMLSGFPPGFISQAENVVSRCYGNDKSLPDSLENLMVKSIMQIGQMMPPNALKINQTALVNKSDNNNTMMMPMNMNMNMPMNMNMTMDMNMIMNMHQNMTMMKPGNFVNCSFFLAMLELIRSTTNETQGLVTSTNPFCPLLSFAATLAWEAMVTDTNYMNHSLFQLMLWSAQPFIQFGLKPEKLSSMAPKFFMGSHRKLAMDVFNKFYDNMPQGVKEKIVQWVKNSVIMETLNCTMGNQMTSEAGMIKGKCPEPPVWLKSDALSTLGRFLPQVSDSDLEQIPADELCKFFNQNTFFDTFKQMYDLNQKQGKMLMSKLSSQCLDSKKSESVFARLGALACFYDNVDSLNKNQSQILLPQMSGCKNPGTNKIIADMMKTAMGSEPLTAQMLKILGNTTKSLSVSQLCSINGSDIRNNIEDLGKISWTKEQSTALVQKYIKEVKTPSSSDLAKMGKLIKGVPCSVIQNMKGDQLFNIAGLEDNAQDLSPAQKKAFINTILKNVNISTVLQTFSGPLISTLSLYTIQQANINAVDRIVGKNWTKCQAIYLVKQVFSGKIQPSDIKKLGSAIQGITCDMFNSLSDQDILTTASILEQNKDWLSRHQMTCFAKKLWAALNTTRADYFSSIQDSEMQLIPTVFLMFLPPSQIAKIPAKACSSFLEKMASADITLLPRTSLTRPALRDRALLCLNKTLPLISSSDLQQLGLLVCELNMTEIPASVLNTSLQLFTQCRQLSSSNKAILAKRILTTYGNCSTWKDTTITSLGLLMTFLSSSDLQTLPNVLQLKDTLMELIYSIPDVSKSPAEYDTSLNTASLRQKLFAIIIAPAARRKRAASCVMTPTTQQIMDLKEDNSQWTPDQLLCMSTQTFLDTFAILGSVQSFNEQQLAVLKNKSIDALGPPSSYTIEQILALGCLMVGFTPAELQQVSVTSVDILTGINACPNWTVQKRAVLVQRLINQTGLTVSTMGMVELSGLGNFICGMTAEEIAQINTTSFRMAVGILSTVNCSLTVMEELMKKAVSAFGPISTWTPAWINEIGNIIAGASSTDLQNLNVLLLPMITPAAIALIPPNRFCVLSPDQLRALGPTNAAMVTAEQIAMLNSDQRQGLSDSLGVVIPRATNPETSTKTTTIVVPVPLKGGTSRLALVGILALLQPLFLLAIAP